VKGEKCRSKIKITTPHFLSLSATPIPRTLAHIVFGNLDISTIHLKPVGRKRIKTYLVPSHKRNDSYRFIDELINKGEQAFVVCPLIEEKIEFSKTLFEQSERKAVEGEIKNLQKTVLGCRKIEMLHGRMKGIEKEEKMRKMQSGETDVLVSTSVVEVGIDVPQATVMVIEEAEHFGLSQLHQFRGRVGRNDLQSYCFLFTKENLNDKTRERLKAFVQNDDGFKLAQMDLKGRGPGAILGTNQSGFVGINPVWFENSEVLSKASRVANDLAPELEKNDVLFAKIKERLQTKHLE
jgi:ATP-dependent DNA helicase RecG